MTMLQGYFKRLYERTMREAYQDAYRRIATTTGGRPRIAEAGAGDGHGHARLQQLFAGRSFNYIGLEWNPGLVSKARDKGIEVERADLNLAIPLEDASVDCVFALSVLEHLLNPCRFLLEARRVLRPGGRIVLLTPNIATWFTAVLIVLGRMPSSGPHPDSNALLEAEEVIRVQRVQTTALDQDFPEHRHLVVFSFLVLRRYLRMLGFQDVCGRGFGLYPFPNLMQPLLERLDPIHCHQMVFSAVRPG